MSAWGKLDLSELEQLNTRLKRALKGNVVDQFMREFLQDLAERALRKIKLRTPVDTGLLRNSWTFGEMTRRGDTYEIEIFSNVEYAEWVEFGHMAGATWVDGRFMMTISLQEIERELPSYFERKFESFIRRIMEE